MSLNEALSQGLLVTAVGLLIVFAVLVILMLVLMLFKVFFATKKEEIKSEEKTVAIEEIITEKKDDGELIAVLTAAIAAIDAIGTVAYTDASKALIDAARAAYAAVANDKKAEVTNYATLEAAEAKYAELKAEAEEILANI